MKGGNARIRVRRSLSWGEPPAAQETKQTYGKEIPFPALFPLPLSPQVCVCGVCGIHTCVGVSD